MQAKPEAEVGRINGARQIPLLTADQLVPGVMFAGIASEHVHEVVSVEGEHMMVQRLPRQVLAPGHIHAYTLYTNTTCACGLGRREVRVVLPENRTTPRVHLIVPIGPVVIPRLYSVYLTVGQDGVARMRPVVGGGARVTPAPNTATNDDVPIVTKALEVWTLPDRARALLMEDETGDPIASDGD